jgi:hypothetical protein
MQDRDMAGFLAFRIERLLHLQGSSVLITSQQRLSAAAHEREIEVCLPARLRPVQSLRRSAHALLERRLRNRDPIAALGLAADENSHSLSSGLQKLRSA